MPSETLPTRTAVITGAASGIGLALTRHLLSSTTTHWRVVLADVNAKVGTELAASLGPDAVFCRTDVASWASNAAVFQKAWDWSKGRIDFFAANAGIDDKESVFATTDLDADPQEPNLTTLDVDLKSVFYGLKLFVHYARKTQRFLRTRPSSPSTVINGSHPPFDPYHPKLVITSSCVGLYRFETNPQYCAAKSGLVALTRSIGARFLRDDNLTVNSILPAFVPTNLAPPGLIDAWPPEHITPMETIMRAYDELIDVEEKRTGECVECVGRELYYREQVGYPCYSQEWMVGDVEGFWSAGYGVKGKKGGKVEEGETLGVIEGNGSKGKRKCDVDRDADVGGLENGVKRK
ncbi:MAG: hypothetical protein Q9227_008506 [Pyrenula ochraceoflavens]